MPIVPRAIVTELIKVAVGRRGWTSLVSQHDTDVTASVAFGVLISADRGLFIKREAMGAKIVLVTKEASLRRCDNGSLILLV